MIHIITGLGNQQTPGIYFERMPDILDLEGEVKILIVYAGGEVAVVLDYYEEFLTMLERKCEKLEIWNQGGSISYLRGKIKVGAELIGMLTNGTLNKATRAYLLNQESLILYNQK